MAGSDAALLSRRMLGRDALALAGAAFVTRALPAAVAPPVDPLAFVDPELRPTARVILAMMNTPPRGATLLSVMRGLGGPPPAPLADVPWVEKRVPGLAGAPDVVVYLINARDGATRPAILHTHGGGFISGSAKAEIRAKQELARSLDCVVVTVEYRLAPETRYTGSVADNYAALHWVHANAPALRVDRSRIAVMGESAGGGHAALLAQMARDRGEIPLALQVLIYPMLDDRTGIDRPVPPQIGRIGWDQRANTLGWASFLGVPPGRHGVPPAGVPARTPRLAGLAPAFIGVGSVDLFVEEDIAYARRLTDQGVPTELVVAPGAFHGFDGAAPETQIARRFTAAKIAALRRTFDR
ncbi:alpha/beta hydrolase fold domain-containing protein [Sphingomonas sp. MMS24-J13]|uniref:alpha/beta hydrolase fold domain-containing protein n=1 Tax=Sphingomonas sp. MMS24-J13 TaxID=3238686 RepID=UPI00384EC73F